VLLGSCFQRLAFPKSLDSRTFPRLSYQLLVAKTHKNWTPAVITPRHGQPRKHRSSVAVRLLLSDGTTYCIVEYVAIDTDCAENTIPLLSFTSLCILRAGSCEITSLALSEYATIQICNLYTVIYFYACLMMFKRFHTCDLYFEIYMVVILLVQIWKISILEILLLSLCISPANF
jgi:hypothetical protein